VPARSTQHMGEAAGYVRGGGISISLIAARQQIANCHPGTMDAFDQ
jgi:hypothetical protein